MLKICLTLNTWLWKKTLTPPSVYIFVWVCVCLAVLPKVPWRSEDLCQFVIRHKLPSFMKYQITNWPSIRFPAWKWDCNIWASIRITERAVLSCLLLSWQVTVISHHAMTVTHTYTHNVIIKDKRLQTFTKYSKLIEVFPWLGHLGLHPIKKQYSDFQMGHVLYVYIVADELWFDLSTVLCLHILHQNAWSADRTYSCAHKFPYPGRIYGPWPFFREYKW